MLDKVKNYLLEQADKLTAWIGFVGMILLFLNLHSFLFLLFIALIALPEAHFSSVFKNWTSQLRNAGKDKSNES